MKKIGLLIVSMSIFSYMLKAQIAAGYEVATWYGFKKVAITYSLDDNTSNQIPVAIPVFNKYNYKATFNTVTNWVGTNWSGWQTLATNGHEIASHTVSHATLNAITVAEQDTECKNSQSTIKTNTGSECVTIAYPNCNIGDKTTLAKYYIAGRICDGSIASNSPTDFFNIGSIICGADGTMKTAQNFNDKVSSAVAAKGWCVFLIHGIDNDGGYSSLSSTELDSHLQFVNTNATTYWVATFGTVAKYIKERNALKLVETSITTDSLKLVASHTLTSTLTTYNTAITIRRELPSGWISANVYKNSTKITSTIVTEGSKTYVVFDVIPNDGNIFLAKSTSSTGGTTTTFTELLNNGEFDSGTTGWSMQNNSSTTSTLSASTTAALSGTNAIQICPNATNFGTAEWHIQVAQNVTLEANKEYSFTFMAKAATARTITVMVQQLASTYAVYKTFTYNLTTTAQTFTETFTITDAAMDPACKLTFCVGNNASCVSIDKVSLGYTSTSGGGGGTTPPVTTGAGAYYTDVYRNLFKEFLNKTDAEVQTKINGVWDHFFVNATNKVYFESTNNTAYIMDIGNSDVRTEGMSYGMMICVQLNKQAEFDKLWKWAKTNMLYTTGDYKGYFAWQCKTDGTKIGGASTSPAPDGEAYFITSLFFAANRWGNTTGIDYAAEAQSILASILSRPNTGTNSVYDMFHHTSKLMVFVPYGDSYTHSDPSYNLPGFLELWARWSTTNKTFWEEAVVESRKLLKNSSHPTTGLFPDYCAFDGSPYNPSWKTDYDAKRYQYDAIRCAMNVGVDYHWFRSDTTNQEAMMLKLLTFFKSKNYAAGQYAWDGTSPTGSYSEGMAGANGVGVFALKNNSTLATEYMTRLWNTAAPTGTWRYYNGMVYFLSMLNAAGMYKIYKPAVVCTTPAAPTVTTPVTYCQGATATALTATGTTLKWYTVATGGTGSATAPTPTTTTIGSTTYYVSQTVNTCESARTAIVVSVNAIPTAPTVTSPINYSQGATAIALTATGTSLKWYTLATGGTGSTTAPIPSTVTVGTTNYYVSQTVNGCESPRTKIEVNTTIATLTQNISLVAGWNLISINVVPSNYSVESIFTNILSNVEIIKNADGFYKAGQNASLQSLTQISLRGSYLVKMKTAATLTVTGTAPGAITIPLQQGWNMLGYPVTTSKATTTVLSAIWTNTQSIKNFDGFLDHSSGTLTTMNPGNGYYIYMNAASSLGF